MATVRICRPHDPGSLSGNEVAWTDDRAFCNFGSITISEDE
jgi:hypothetical protein